MILFKGAYGVGMNFKECNSVALSFLTRIMPEVVKTNLNTLSSLQIHWTSLS